jgi:hypothetical protein
VAAVYVTQAQLRTALGIGTLYSDADVESCCQTAEDLLNKYLWFDSYPAVGAGIYSNSALVVISSPVSFVTGQTVVLTNCGAAYNGSHTITGTFPYTQSSVNFPYFINFPYNYRTFPQGYSWISFAVTHADDYYHQIVPYGKVAGVDTKDTSYANTPAINQAALMLAIDIWQARQQSNAGGISPDFTPSPYRMGNTLLARVRGLIAPYTSPRSMVG